MSSTYGCYIRCSGFISFLVLPREFIDKIAYCISTIRSAFCSRAVSPPSNFHGAYVVRKVIGCTKQPQFCGGGVRAFLPSIYSSNPLPPPPQNSLVGSQHIITAGNLHAMLLAPHITFFAWLITTRSSSSHSCIVGSDAFTTLRAAPFSFLLHHHCPFRASHNVRRAPGLTGGFMLFVRANLLMYSLVLGVEGQLL